MKVLVLLSTALLAACASNHPAMMHDTASLDPAEPSEALLLVSLDDGQLVMQHVAIDADFCMKSNAQPETRCFKRGEPIYDTDASTIVAYRLESRDLDLHAR
ncbi:MAG: hypothetical protein HKN59_04340 [Gammaproteobacteria bacterium]|nr:hypothetical protein [Gammaproteobacteria bacterium]NNF51648.1 hypothetical protein [Gammaproteobacteria bacterium]